jgi:hypothetical protein
VLSPDASEAGFTSSACSHGLSDRCSVAGVLCTARIACRYASGEGWTIFVRMGGTGGRSARSETLVMVTFDLTACRVR